MNGKFAKSEISLLYATDPFKGRGPRAVLILCCFAVYSTGRFMFSLALFFVLVLFSVILAL